MVPLLADGLGSRVHLGKDVGGASISFVTKQHAPVDPKGGHEGRPHASICAYRVRAVVNFVPRQVKSPAKKSRRPSCVDRERRRFGVVLALGEFAGPLQ